MSSFILMKNLDDKNVKNFIQLFILNMYMLSWSSQCVRID